MATPDARLLQLIAVLADVGLDWLGYELLNAVRDGVPAEESQETLLSAQRAVREHRQLKPELEWPQALPPLPQQLNGPDQLPWATAYIMNRVTDAMAMVGVSLDQLNRITEFRQPHIGVSEERGREQRFSGIELQLGEDGPTLESFDYAAVQAALADLRRALDAWVDSNLDGGAQ